MRLVTTDRTTPNRGTTLAAAAAVGVLALVGASFGRQSSVPEKPASAPSAPPAAPNTPAAPAAAPAAPAAPQPGQPPRANLGVILTNAMKSVPGCHGAEAAQLQSGKLMIMGFFKDKQAAMVWYNHPMHQRMQDAAAPNRDKTRAPMADVPDGVPLMIVASMTPAEKPPEGSTFPFSQIAIEVYTPLTSGLNFGGGFAPEEFRALPRITQVGQEPRPAQ